MKKLALLFIPALIIACKSNVNKEKISNVEVTTEKTVSANNVNSDAVDQTYSDVFRNSEKLYVYENKLDVEDLVDSIDFNMDISKMSISDIRILRNASAAKQGFCFMDADLRAIFSTTSWYDKRMEYRYWQEEEGKTIHPISYSGQELAFIEKLTNQENELKSQNFITMADRKMPNMNNIIN
jgi:hypothetical protein